MNLLMQFLKILPMIFMKHSSVSSVEFLLKEMILKGKDDDQNQKIPV